MSHHPLDLGELFLLLTEDLFNRSDGVIGVPLHFFKTSLELIFCDLPLFLIAFEECEFNSKSIF